MTVILETKNFIIESHPAPEISRTDGGHLRISPKTHFVDRTEMSPELLKEMVLPSSIFGKALKKAMGNQGIEVGRINCQDNGNWIPSQHLHLYGRAINATYHTFGHPIRSAWTKEKKDKIYQEPLNEKDLELIKKYAIEFSKEKGFEEIKFLNV